MSDFFSDDPRGPAPGGGGPAAPPRPVRSRRPGPLVLTLIVLAVLLIAFSLFATVWTDRLWFKSVGYSEVFSTLLWTKVGMFLGFGLVMALVVGGNLWVAYRIRPLFRANSAEQANLERYREVITPIRKVLLVATSLVFAVFAGASATGQWRTYLLWQNRQSFGQDDPYFDKDIGFYVFTLPWLHWLVDFAMTAFVIGLLAAVFVHYVYGGIRLQARSGKVSGPAQVQISVLLGLLVLIKAFDYYLDRFDLATDNGGIVTGMTYVREHAVLPGKNILIAIAVICAVLFFANIFRRTWLLPGTGLALFALAAVLIGMIWPAVVQRFQVKPDEPDKESSYIAKNIESTRKAFNIDLGKDDIPGYQVGTDLDTAKVKRSPSIPDVRLLDPRIVRDAFEQLQQQKGYYTVSPLLDVDRYTIDGQERDLVVASREINLAGLPDAQKKWANEHTVYTHGYGMIAAYGNQRDATNTREVGGDGQAPVWAEKDLPPVGELTGDDEAGSGYEGRIYFGENSPEYSIVGKKSGGKDVELDIPQGSGTPGESKTSTYDGKGGVPVGSLFNKLLYAVKLGDPNMVLSSRVNENSKILYDRSPRERVQKVAPWLTVDSDALPAVVDGRIVWILDGYTVTDRYPLSQKRSLKEMTSDAISTDSQYTTLPTDEINYMRNAVKATVDAYDGTVTLYEWDSEDPLLKAWEGVFPGVVKAKSSIPEDLLAHFRYPEDMFKVQRNLLAEYHVTDAKTFYEGNDKWEVPEDPDKASTKQPPYRLSVSPRGNDAPVFSLTSVYVPAGKSNVISFMSVGADATKEDSYGKFTILRLPDSTQVPGPAQIANQFAANQKVADALRPFKSGTDAGVKYGNLLTLPIDGGLLYVQPLYTVREGGSGKYPVLQYVVASYGNRVGIGSTLTEALDNIVETTSEADPDGSTDPDGTPDPDVTPDPDGSADPGTGDLSAQAMDLLRQANRQFALADQALKAGDLQEYADRIAAGRKLVDRALQAEIRNAQKKP